MKNILLLSLSLFMFSCIYQKPKVHYIAAGIHAAKLMRPVANPNVITINQENHETVPYTELRNILKDVKYIPLVSKEPIGEWKKILIYRERIFVLDAHKAEKVFIFNMQGKIINIIDSKGGGPEEYTGLYDMNISPEEDCILLNDRLARYTLYFSLDGQFIRKDSKIANCGFAIMGNSIINQVTTGQSFEDGLDWHLVVTTKGDSIIRKGFPFYPIQLKSITYRPLFYNSMGELLFVPPLSDTVYQILNDSTYTVRYIVKQKQSIWEKYNQDIDDTQYNDLIRNSNYTSLRTPILETERFVYIPVAAKIKINDKYFISKYNYWYDKTQSVVFNLEEFDYSNLKPIYHDIPSPIAISGNYFAGIITIDFIETYRKNLARSSTYDSIFKNEELKSLIKSATPDLEAILVLYEFK